MRDSPLIRTGSKRSRSTRLPTTLAAQLLDTNPIGRRGLPSPGGTRQPAARKSRKPRWKKTGRRMVVAAAKNGPSGPEIRLESTRGEPGRRSPARRGSGGTMDHPIKPLGGGSIKNRQGEGQSASQNGLARKSAGGGAQVAPPADRLVLYSRARSSWKSVHSSESNELPASREQRDDRKGGKPAGADTVPTVRTACPATKHEKAPEEPARRGTATKARLPFLFAGGAQDVLHLPGLEEPSTHDSRSVFRGRRPVGPGGVRCWIQAGSMGAIPPHRGGRGRPGLSADRYFAETLWPIPGRSQRGAAGSTIYHPHSSHEGYDARPRGSAGGIGVCRERPRWFRPRGR